MDLLFGSDSPSGRLSVTFPYSESQVPANDADYDMRAGTGRPSFFPSLRYSTLLAPSLFPPLLPPFLSPSSSFLRSPLLLSRLCHCALSQAAPIVIRQSSPSIRSATGSVTAHSVTPSPLLPSSLPSHSTPPLEAPYTSPSPSTTQGPWPPLKSSNCTSPTRPSPLPLLCSPSPGRS